MKNLKNKIIATTAGLIALVGSTNAQCLKKSENNSKVNFYLSAGVGHSMESLKTGEILGAGNNYNFGAGFDISGIKIGRLGVGVEMCHAPNLWAGGTAQAKDFYRMGINFDYGPKRLKTQEGLATINFGLGLTASSIGEIKYEKNQEQAFEYLKTNPTLYFKGNFKLGKEGILNRTSVFVKTGWEFDISENFKKRGLDVKTGLKFDLY